MGGDQDVVGLEVDDAGPEDVTIYEELHEALTS